MKYLIILLFSLFAVTLAAQQSSVSVNEVENDDSYEFSIRSTELTPEVMNRIFSELSEGNFSGRATGTFHTTLDDGVKLIMDTNDREFEIRYAGKDEEAMTHAKSLATTLKEHLNPDDPDK